MLALSYFQIYGAFGHSIVSQEYNDRLYEIYGKNAVIDKFEVAPESAGMVSVSLGSAILSGVLVSPMNTAPAKHIIQLPANNSVPDGQVWYIYVEYTHVNSTGDFESMVEIKFSQNNPGESKNILLLAKVNRRYNVSAVTSSDIVKIENKRISLSDLLRIERDSNKSLFEASQISKLKLYIFEIDCAGKNSVDVPLPAFRSTLDTLVLFLNSSVMIRDKDYSLSQSSGSIAKVTFTNTPVGFIDFMIIQNLIPSTNPVAQKLLDSGIGACVSHQISSGPMQDGTVSYKIPIDGIDKNKDQIMVSANSVMYSEGIEYTLSADSSTINFSRPREAGETVDMIVFRNFFQGSIKTSSDGSLAQDVKAFIESLGDKPWVLKISVNITTSNRYNMTVPDISYNIAKDSTMIFKNSTILLEGKDYSVSQAPYARAIVNFSPGLEIGEKLEIVIFKNMAVDDYLVIENQINKSAEISRLKEDIEKLVAEVNNLRSRAVFT